MTSQSSRSKESGLAYNVASGAALLLQGTELGGTEQSSSVCREAFELLWFCNL